MNSLFMENIVSHLQSNFQDIAELNAAEIESI